MAMQKQYRPQEIEPALEERWQAEGTYRFDPQSTAPVYSVDTPPPTVSGKLHIGHFLYRLVYLLELIGVRIPAYWMI